MAKLGHIYRSLPLRKLRHRCRRDDIIQKLKRKPRAKGFKVLMQNWRRRHFDCIFPNVKNDVELDCKANALRAIENVVDETRVASREQIRSQEQIKYGDRYWLEPWLKVYKIIDTSEAEEVLERLRLYGNVHQRKPIILPSLADIPCADLGVDGLLKQLNEVLHTEYPLSPSLSHLLNSYIAKSYDFGTAYAHLRPLWYDNHIKTKLRKRESWDRKMREEALVDNIIVSRLVPPRRVWDLYSNRVVPWWVACQNPWAISHAWMDETSRKSVLTSVNGYQWPVPIPKDTNMDHIRIEMLYLGAEYVWLDVLCLRQTGCEDEDIRKAEWKVDVPSIGRVYEMAERVVYYFCGLGRPFTAEERDLESDRSWFRRAWTLQEIHKRPIIGGTTIDNDMVYEMMPAKFRERLSSLGKIAQRVSEQTDIFAILSHMRDRVSTTPIDRIAGLAYLLRPKIIPAYYEAQSEEDAWTALVKVIAQAYKAPMLFLYPEPGNGGEIWRPSWNQVMSGSLPYYDPQLLYDPVSWNQETNTHSYKAYFIESALVRGLDREGKRGISRRGEFIVKDRFTGTEHRFAIVATHQYPIAKGWYTIFSSLNRGLHSEDSRYWVCGQRLPGPKKVFKKVSVFQMPYFVDADRLRTLRIAEMSRVILA